MDNEELRVETEESTVETAAESTVSTEESTGKWALKGRLKSKALWVSVAGLVMALFTAFGIWDKIGIDSDAFDGVVTAIGGLLTAFGILNNPTDSEGF